jgi:hypothetical protein
VGRPITPASGCRYGISSRGPQRDSGPPYLADSIGGFLMARTANRMKDRRVLFGVRNGRGDGIDWPSPSISELTRRHDAFIVSGTRPRSYLRSSQLLGGAECRCVLATARFP